MTSLFDWRPTTSIQTQFLDFHRANPIVYQTLVRLAREWVSIRGRERLGIGMLWEVMRWEMKLRGLPAVDQDFKLNNNYRSRYARLIMERESDLRDVFEIRALRSE